MYDKYLIEKGEDINSIAKKFLTKESVLMEIAYREPNAETKATIEDARG